MKRSVIGFFLTFCFLLSSGYRQIYAQTIEGTDGLNIIRARHAALFAPVSTSRETIVCKAEAVEIEEADDEPTSLKKHLESPYFFSTPGILDTESIKLLQDCKPQSSILSHKWYLFFEVFRV